MERYLFGSAAKVAKCIVLLYLQTEVVWGMCVFQFEHPWVSVRTEYYIAMIHNGRMLLREKMLKLFLLS